MANDDTVQDDVQAQAEPEPSADTPAEEAETPGEDAREPVLRGSIARKVGMTRVFTDEGEQVPVTVLEVGPCVVLDRKTQADHGYEAAQIGFDDRKESRATKAIVGHCKKAGTGPKRVIREFPVSESDDVQVGDTITVRSFEGIDYVDVVGTTKGRGFQGVMKRHNMAGGRMSHGAHARRRPGAIGCSSYPANVSKGKAMPGHMGNRTATQQNLAVVQVRAEENLLLVRGAVPGPRGGTVLVRAALKKKTGAAS